MQTKFDGEGGRVMQIPSISNCMLSNIHLLPLNAYKKTFAFFVISYFKLNIEHSISVEPQSFTTHPARKSTAVFIYNADARPVA